MSKLKIIQSLDEPLEKKYMTLKEFKEYNDNLRRLENKMWQEIFSGIGKNGMENEQTDDNTEGIGG